MKFQNPSIHHSKVNTQTDTQTDKPKAICPSNFFKVGGIKIQSYAGREDMKKFHDTLKTIYDRKSSGVCSVQMEALFLHG